MLLLDRRALCSLNNGCRMHLTQMRWRKHMVSSCHKAAVGLNSMHKPRTDQMRMVTQSHYISPITVKVPKYYTVEQ
jgi:hypothetical protein